MVSAQQQPEHAHRVYGDQQEIVDQHAEGSTAPTCPGIHGTARDPDGVQPQPRGMGHSDAHGDGAANGGGPRGQFHTEAQGIAAVVSMYPLQCGTKYSKHNVMGDLQGERIHPVSVVCCYFLAGAAGVMGAVTAGLAAGAVALGFSV